VTMTLDGIWRMVVHCPYCSCLHKHGGGNGVRPSLGWRGADCGKGEYIVVFRKETCVIGLPANYFEMERA